MIKLEFEESSPNVFRIKSAETSLRYNEGSSTFSIGNVSDSTIIGYFNHASYSTEGVRQSDDDWFYDGNGGYGVFNIVISRGDVRWTANSANENTGRYLPEVLVMVIFQIQRYLMVSASKGTDMTNIIIDLQPMRQLLIVIYQMVLIMQKKLWMKHH